jgi:hypothetical protein
MPIRLLLVLTVFLSKLANPNQSLAQTDPVTPGGSGFADLSQLEKVFGNVVTSVTILAGFAAFVIVIWGGFKYLVAQGDPKAVSAARSTLTWGILGLAILIISWITLAFISQFTGVNLTQFCLPINKSCP